MIQIKRFLAAVFLFALSDMVIGHANKAGAGFAEIRAACRHESDSCILNARKGFCAASKTDIKARAVRANCPCSCDFYMASRIRQCCETVGDTSYKQACIPLCRYNTTATELTVKKNIACIPQLHVWVYCSADEQDSTDCCQEAGVPEECQSFCRGQVPTCEQSRLLSQYGHCVGHLDTVLACHRQSLTSLPAWKLRYRGQCNTQA